MAESTDKTKTRGGDDSAKRAGRARAIADLMPNIGQAAFRKFGFIQASIVTRWAEIVGSRYAAVSAPESIRFPVGKKAGGTLHLIVAGSHAPMMQHVLPEIIERVNRFFGYAAVGKITLRQGDMPHAAPARATTVMQPLPAELGDSLRDIGDPELRTVLEALAQGLANSQGIPKVR
jgi:hypothetical protein